MFWPRHNTQLKRCHRLEVDCMLSLYLSWYLSLYVICVFFPPIYLWLTQFSAAVCIFIQLMRDKLQLCWFPLEMQPLPHLLLPTTHLLLLWLAVRHFTSNLSVVCSNSPLITLSSSKVAADACVSKYPTFRVWLCPDSVRETRL